MSLRLYLLLCLTCLQSYESRRHAFIFDRAVVPMPDELETQKKNHDVAMSALAELLLSLPNSATSRSIARTSSASSFPPCHNCRSSNNSPLMETKAASQSAGALFMNVTEIARSECDFFVPSFENVVKDRAPLLKFEYAPEAYYYRLVTNQPIKKGTTVIRVPGKNTIRTIVDAKIDKHTLTVLTGGEPSKLAAFGNWWKDVPVKVRLAAQLVATYREPDTSVHASYVLGALPPLSASATEFEIRYPRRWSDAALATLRRPGFIASIKQQRSEWAELARGFAEAVVPSPDIIPEEELYWAMEHVNSRAFFGQCNPSKSLGQYYDSFLKDWGGRPDTTALLPVIDSTNHKPLNQNPLDYNSQNDYYYVSAGTDYPAGVEFHISYGARNAQALLQFFGFVIEDNPQDVVTVELPSADGSSFGVFFGRGGDFARGGEVDKLQKFPWILIAKANPGFIDQRKAAVAIVGSAKIAMAELEDRPDDRDNAGDPIIADLCEAYRREKRRILKEVIDFWSEKANR